MADAYERFSRSERKAFGLKKSDQKKKDKAHKAELRKLRKKKQQEREGYDNDVRD